MCIVKIYIHMDMLQIRCGCILQEVVLLPF